MEGGESARTTRALQMTTRTPTHHYHITEGPRQSYSNYFDHQEMLSPFFPGTSQILCIWWRKERCRKDHGANGEFQLETPNGN